MMPQAIGYKASPVIEPLLTLHEGQFSQHNVTQRVKQITIFSPSHIEIHTVSGKQIAASTAPLAYPNFATREQIKYCCSQAQWIITQDAEIYSVSARIRGTGGGVDEDRQKRDAYYRALATNYGELGKQLCEILPRYEQQGFDIKKINEGYGTALKFAISKNDKDAIPTLINAITKYDNKICRETGYNPLVDLITGFPDEDFCVEMAQLLIKTRPMLVYTFPILTAVKLKKYKFISLIVNREEVKSIHYEIHRVLESSFLISPPSTSAEKLKEAEELIETLIQSSTVFSHLSYAGILSKPLSNIFQEQKPEWRKIVVSLLKQGASPQGIFSYMFQLIPVDQDPFQKLPQEIFQTVSACLELMAAAGYLIDTPDRKTNLTQLASLCLGCTNNNRWNDHSRTLALFLIEFGADIWKIPQNIWDPIPEDVKVLLMSSALSSSDVLKIAQTLTAKIIEEELSSDIANDLYDLNKFEFLRQKVQETLMEFKVINSFHDEKKAEVLLKRQSFIKEISTQLSKILEKRINFNPAQGFLNIEKVQVGIREAITLWETSQKQEHKSQLEKKSHLDAQLQAQKDLLKQQSNQNANLLMEQTLLREEIQAQTQVINQQNAEAQQQSRSLQHLNKQIEKIRLEY